MKEKDKRYQVVKIMIENGNVKVLNDIFYYIPRSIVADDLSTNYNRLVRLLDHPQQWTLEDLFKIAAFCEVENETIVKLACSQHAAIAKKNVKP